MRKNFFSCLLAFLLIATGAIAQTPFSRPSQAYFGGTATLAASATSSSVAIPADINAFGAIQIINDGQVPVFVAQGNSSVVATASSLKVAPSESISFGLIPGTTNIAAITASGTAAIRVVQWTGAPSYFGANTLQYNVPYFVTSSQTLALPAGWHVLQFKSIGGAGGAACGVVTASGTTASGGGSGGSATRIDGEFLSSVTGGNSLVVSIGAAGTPCVASGTIAGSSGTTPTAGGDTVLTIGAFSRTAWHAGAGSNGAQGANSAGGGSGGFCAPGGNASGATAGSASCGGLAGGSGAAGPASSVPWVGEGGVGDTAGIAGVAGTGSSGPGVGGSGAGLAATPVALVGGAGTRGGPLASSQAQGGLATCTGTSQNGGNGSAVGGSGTDLTGSAGGGGASCIASNGGNGGNASGFGASGGAGGSALVGFLAGSAGNGTGGAALIEVF